MLRLQHHLPSIFAGLLFLVSTGALAQNHTVKSGDTIAKIAHFYAVSPKELMKLNGLKNAKQLSLGDSLEIPETLLGNARRKAVIKQGDTIAKIARKYKVSRKELRELNRLKRRDVLQLGQTLAIPNPPGDPGPKATDSSAETDDKPSNISRKPKWAGGVKGLVEQGRTVDNGVMHTVQYGQTLWMISRGYNVSDKKIKRKNKISKKNPLRPGMEILIPGAKHAVPVRTSKYKPHTVHIVRVKKTRRLKLRIVNTKDRVVPASRRRIGRLLGYKAVKPRLIWLLQRIAERFPGKAISIYSGYRPPVRGHRSYHSRNAAIDFAVQGVSNEQLYGFISSFSDVGCGYYPNSIHVHLDVRDKKFMWTDVSGRGESANYADESHPQHWKNVKDTL